MSSQFKGVTKKRSLCIFQISDHPYFDTKDTLNASGKPEGTEKPEKGKLVFLTAPLTAYALKLKFTIATDDNIKQLQRLYTTTVTYLDKDKNAKKYTNQIEVIPSGGFRQNFFELGFSKPVEFTFLGRWDAKTKKQLPNKKIKLPKIRIPYPSTGIIVDNNNQVKEKGVPINKQVILAIVKSLPAEIKKELYSLSINGNKSMYLAKPSGATTSVRAIKSLEAK